MARKPKLSFWDIWNMSFGFFGIQMGFGLQLSNMSRIFQTLGSGVEDLALYWIAGPITGLLVQPIIGYLSDNTWSPRWGRRRPYFAIGAVLASIAMFIMPNSPVLWISIGMLWIMDSSFNIAMEPFRAFVGDKLPSDQRTLGFATQSFFIGAGAVIASVLPYAFANWFGVSNVAEANVIPDSVKWSFYVGAVAFFFAVMYTVFKSKEYSPEELESFDEYRPVKEASLDVEDRSVEWLRNNGGKQLFLGAFFLIIGFVFSSLVYKNGWSRDLYILAGIFALFGQMFVTSGIMSREGKRSNAFVKIMTDMQHMPKTMKQLALVQFFSWFGLFAMWIYTTPAITEAVFNTTDPTSKAYGEGADWVGLCFGMYNLVTMLFAFCLPAIAKATSRRMTHLICLVLGGLGLISMFFIKDQNLLMVSMIGVGIAWASILAMPYAMLTSSLPVRKMGYYMGVFNFFIVLPQLVAASLLGFLLGQFFGGSSIYALLIGGASMILAGLLNLMVDDKDDPALG